MGPVTDVSGKMARGIVSRLSIASDVQTLCTLAIEKADDWLVAVSSANPNCIGMLATCICLQLLCTDWLYCLII